MGNASRRPEAGLASVFALTRLLILSNLPYINSTRLTFLYIEDAASKLT